MASNATSASGPTKKKPSTFGPSPTSSKNSTMLSNTFTITEPHLTTKAKTSSAVHTRVSSTGSPSNKPSSSISVDPTPTASSSRLHGSNSDLQTTSDLSSLTDSHASLLPTEFSVSPPPSSNTTGLSSPGAGADGLNKAIIAGAAIGAVAVVAVVAFGVWFLRRIKKRQGDDDISMVGVPRPEDVPMGMPSGIRLVRGNLNRK